LRSHLSEHAGNSHRCDGHPRPGRRRLGIAHPRPERRLRGGGRVPVRSMRSMRSPEMTRYAWVCCAIFGFGACRDGTVDGGGDDASKPFVDAVFDAFASRPIVAVADAHGLQELQDTIAKLLMDPRAPLTMNDVVVEFGNALYQDTMDRFAFGGIVD